jgi:hypothetical protein
MLLLLKSRNFPMREFEDWEAMQNKTWPLLKTFVHGANACKLVASTLCNMTGQLGYVQLAHNMYKVLETDKAREDASTITQMAVGNTYQTPPSTVPQELTQQSTRSQQTKNCCFNTLPH